MPRGASGVVIFSHGSGSSRHSPRNKYVALRLQSARLGTLLLDLLTSEEDASYETRFNIDLLTDRLKNAVLWTKSNDLLADLRIGLFGSSTGAASALRAAAVLPDAIAAVVSRGGRPDLAGDPLKRVVCPCLFIVGENDREVVPLNEEALEFVSAKEKRLSIVPGATHLFEESGALEEVADLSMSWFQEHLQKSNAER